VSVLLKVLAARSSEYFTAWMGRSHVPACSLTCPPKERVNRVCGPSRPWARCPIATSARVWGIWDGGVMSWRATISLRTTPGSSRQTSMSPSTSTGNATKPIAEKSARRSRWSQPPGLLEGDLDYLVKERQEWWGRVRRPDRHHVWIRAVDLCEAKEHGWP
jgi:hypothetical protein